MSASMDLNLIPVIRYAGGDYPELLGLHVAEAPRRSARSRGGDRLILYLVMQGNAPLPPGRRDRLLADLANLYYGTQGSATTALRLVAEELNRLLLERNHRISGGGRQGVGLFAQAVLRNDQLYLALSGPVHGFLICADGAQHFYDADMAEQSLGQSRVAPISYFNAHLESNDTFLLSALPSPEWNENSLTGLHGQGPESIRRRLLSQDDLDLNAVLVQARPGQGKFYLPRAQDVQSERPVAGLDRAHAAPTGKLAAAGPASRVKPAAPQDMLVAEADMTPASAPQIHQAGIPPSASPAVSEIPVSTTPGEERVASPALQRKEKFTPLRDALAVMSVFLGGLGSRMWNGLRRLLTRLLPVEELFNLPSTIMAFAALAVPLIIVAVAFTVYSQLGVTAKYDELYSQAEQMALQAMAQTDLSAKRTGLQSTYEILDQAEDYRSTQEIEDLRLQVRTALDDLDLVKRVDYQPAIIGGLPPEANITRLALWGKNLYLLDQTSGNVYYATFTSQGYRLDESFQCNPDLTGGFVGPLIDIMVWPVGFEPQASLAAFDDSGGVLFCQQDKGPTRANLVASPTSAWGNIVSLSMDLGDTYVLDPSTNGVWVYWRSIFTEEPNMIFDEEIPNLSDVSALAVNKDDIYLLHKDGHLTLCIFSGLSGVPTRCSDPAYVDFRPSRENVPLVPANPFSQILVTPPPDPSLFFLDPKSHAIFHFSLRNLLFQHQYLPVKALPSGSATAFVVDNIQQILLLAIGNEVYYAPVP
jgi:hypothetical protein